MMNSFPLGKSPRYASERFGLSTMALDTRDIRGEMKNAHAIRYNLVHINGEGDEP